MRRPHPYLALSLVCAAVVLVTLSALACPAQAQRAVPSDVEMLPVINGWAIWPGSPECPRRSDRNYIPTQERVRAILYYTTQAIAIDLDTGALTTPLTYGEWRLAMQVMHEMRPKFSERPTWVMGAVPPGYTPNCGQYLCICAAGIGTLQPQISTDEPGRVESLVAYETTNATLGLINRPDLWDGPYVGSVTRRVEQQLGGWKTE